MPRRAAKLRWDREHCSHFGQNENNAEGPAFRSTRRVWLRDIQLPPPSQRTIQRQRQTLTFAADPQFDSDDRLRRRKTLGRPRSARVPKIPWHISTSGWLEQIRLPQKRTASYPCARQE